MTDRTTVAVMETHALCPGGTYEGVLKDSNVLYFPAIDYATYDSEYQDATLVTRDSNPTNNNALQLSVTIPADARLGADLPVVCCIHGGAYEFGERDEPWFSGDTFAQEGVITVSVSYRLGLPGFAQFNADTLELGNRYRGINDCLLALDWIQANIEDFGGDPTNVTLTGQSAGAGIALWLCRRDHFKGTFRRLWAMSPGFPRRSFAQRKGLLRAILGAPITRTSLETLPQYRINKAYNRFKRTIWTDLALGPAPWEPKELADIDIVITYATQEMRFHEQVSNADQKRWMRPLRGLLARRVGMQGTYAADSEYYYSQLLSDALFLRAIELTAAQAPQKVWIAQYRGDDENPASHCCDIPWFFGAQEQVTGTRFDVLPHVPGKFRADVHRRVLNFIHGKTPDWPKYDDHAGRFVLDMPIDGSPAEVIRDPLNRVRQAYRPRSN